MIFVIYRNKGIFVSFLNQKKQGMIFIFNGRKIIFHKNKNTKYRPKIRISIKRLLHSSVFSIRKIQDSHILDQLQFVFLKALYYIC